MTTLPRVTKTTKYESLISPVRDRNNPIYNWHAFKHSYSKELVERLVKKFNLGEDSWVLDPFSGGGTTLLACKELGINSKGIDILPFSVFLSNVKTRNYNPDKLREQLKKFSGNFESAPTKNSLPDIGIMNKAFSSSVKNELLDLKFKINQIKVIEIRDFYMLGLLGILESVSNTQKAGGFLRVVEKNVSAKEVAPRFLSKIETMINDVVKFNGGLKFNKVKVDAQLSDSRKFSARKKFDAIITSPPYPNRHDYTRIYGLEMIFDFVKNNKELKQVRYDTLRSHVEAKKRFKADGYKKPEIINKLVTKIKKAGLNNSKVPEMIDGYFEDMYLSLCQMQKHLKVGGKIALVVSNVRFGGVSIPVDQILARIGEQAGLSTEAVLTARYRGNSAQQMGKFKRKPSRESIIIWEKT
ncbi:MAG: DNA methyltransferase [Patescibacteria group bacterium]|nr:DNA methyltransferase [Patescibacteria group bacterium]